MECFLFVLLGVTQHYLLYYRILCMLCSGLLTVYLCVRCCRTRGLTSTRRLLYFVENCQWCQICTKENRSKHKRHYLLRLFFVRPSVQTALCSILWERGLYPGRVNISSPPPPSLFQYLSFDPLTRSVFACVVCRRHGPAPVSSVLQSPKDTPLEFFQDSGRPLSARMSDKPGGAFSGLRPRSFSRVKGPMRSRVSSIEEEDIMSARGQQPLVGQKSYSGAGAGGFGRSESSVGGGGGDRPLSSRRIAGSRSRERKIPRNRSREVDNSSGEKEVGRSRSNSGSVGRKSVPGGGRGLASQPAPAKDGRSHPLLKSQHNSVGTALHAIDTTGSAINGGATHATVTGTVDGGVATVVPQRRASASGPVGRSNGGHKGGSSAFESSPTDGGGTMLPRRTSASNLPSMTGGDGGGGAFDSVTTVGTPGSISADASKTPVARGLTRAATARAPQGGGFGMRGR